MSAPEIEIILTHDGAELARKSLPPGTYVIGRSPEVEIFANTPLLSRRHARLTIHDDHLLLEDLGSSNGTFVNGKRVLSQAALASGDEIRLGKYRFLVDLGDKPGGVYRMPDGTDPLAATRKIKPNEQ